MRAICVYVSGSCALCIDSARFLLVLRAWYPIMASCQHFMVWLDRNFANQINKKYNAVTDPCHCCVVHHWYLLGFSVDAQYPCRSVGAVVIAAVSCKIIPPVCDETRHDRKIVKSCSVECDGVVCGCWLVVCDQLSRCPGAGGGWTVGYILHPG